MKKIFIRLICAILCLSLMPVISFAANEDATLLVNSSFNSYTTYAQADDLDISSKFSWIHEYDEMEKGLVIAGEKSSSMLSFDVTSKNELCISFDILCTIGCPSGSLNVTGTNGKKQTLINFDGYNHVKTYNGKYIGGYNKSNIKNVAVVFSPSESSCDIWYDGKRKAEDYKIKSLAVADVASVSFEFSHTDVSAVLLDNINIHEGTAPLKNYPVEEYVEDATDPISMDEVTFEPVLGTSVLHKSDFEIQHTLSVSRGGNNKVDVVEEEDGNHALRVSQVYTTGDPHINAFNLGSESDYIIYEFRVKAISDTSFFNMTLTDENGKSAHFANLSPGRLMYMGKSVRTLNANQWYKVSVGIDYYDRKVTYWFDGEKIGTEDMSETVFPNSSKPVHLRFHITRYNGGTTLDLTKTSYDFMLDNINVYDGKEPVDDIGSVEKIITLKNKSVFDKNTTLRRQLKDYVTLHTRSGVVLKDGKKDIIMDTPHEENGVMMVNTAQLSEKLGVSNPYTEKYVPAEKYFTEGLGKKIYTDNTCLNGGMIIAGDTKYKAPTDPDALQELNDFLWYLHPDDDVVKALYEQSPQKGQHPRLHATAEDFARIREEVKTDPDKALWASAVIGAAEQAILQDVVFYELRDGSRLLSVSREVERKMYSLGMAYQLTGEQKYVDRAWKELEAVCSFPDWHPAHSLDVGEMAAGVAVGYDWMYHGFSEQQRAVIEKGIYSNALYDANILYETAKGQMSTLAIGDSNWNNIISGGISLASMAMMDVYPDIAYRTLGNTVKAMSLLMWRFAPYGSWYEGPGYWELTMQYTTKLLDCLGTVFGTSMGLDTAEGLQYAAEAEMQQQSPFGIYNYGDGGEGTKVYCPEMIWLAQHYDRDDVAALVVDNVRFANGEDYALALVWKDSSLPAEGATLDLDKYYEDAYVRVMRDTWEGDEQTFVGIHAGPTWTDHFHLDGASFVFDSMGVRWARDIGMGNYNQANYWVEDPGSPKWSIFRMRAEAHNTIVINQYSTVEDHKIDSEAPFVRMESKPKGAITVVDTTDLFIDGVTSGRRGFAFCDNRSSLVIRDEVNVKADSDIYWFMLTGASVAIDGNKAILTEKGRKLELEFVSNADAELSVDLAKPLPTSPTHPEDGKETVNRIMIKAKGSGNVNVTVKLTPYGGGLTSVSDWDKSIDEWYIEDGEIPPKPKLASVNIGTDTLIPTANTVDYYYLEGTLTSVPQISAYDERYNITVNYGATLGDVTLVDVVDKNNPQNTTTYSVVFHGIPQPKQFDGMTSIPVTSVVASAEPQELNRATNVLDNDLSTRWSADGAGCTLTLDCGSVQQINNIAIAFASGDVRSTRMEIAVSADGASYEDVWAGLSCGTTLEHEIIPIGAKQARYVRLTFNGNTSTNSSQWNSVTEVVVTRNNQ